MRKRINVGIRTSIANETKILAHYIELKLNSIYEIECIKWNISIKIEFIYPSITVHTVINQF